MAEKRSCAATIFPRWVWYKTARKHGGKKLDACFFMADAKFSVSRLVVFSKNLGKEMQWFPFLQFETLPFWRCILVCPKSCNEKHLSFFPSGSVRCLCSIKRFYRSMEAVLKVITRRVCKKTLKTWHSATKITEDVISQIAWHENRRRK